MDKDAATGDLLLLKGIRDSHLILGNQPYVTIDAPMIGEVELGLLFAWRVGFVIAVVGTDGDDKIIANSIGGQGDGDGQIAAFVFLDLLAIDVDGLLTHDGLEVEGDVATFALRRQLKMLAIPSNALIVATATGLSGHQLDGMGRRDHLPRLIVKILSLSTSHIA